VLSKRLQEHGGAVVAAPPKLARIFAAKRPRSELPAGVSHLVCDGRYTNNTGKLLEDLNVASIPDTVEVRTLTKDSKRGEV
jgi:hypothetical protein